MMIDAVGIEGEIVSIKPVRLGLVGCGSHAYRNILPPLRQIPEALMTAFCDRHVEKARLYGRTFSADAEIFSSVEEMLHAETVDAVLVVVGFNDETGEPLYPSVVEPILRKGLPVWMEKPPAANRHQVESMIEAAESGRTFAQVGFKKIFSPAVERLAQICALPDFGTITRYSYSYDVDLPARVGCLTTPSGRRFLDDFVHVASVIDLLIGCPSRVQVTRGPSGSGVIVNQHANGTIGAIMLSNLSSGLAPVERIEIVGEGANAVLENGAFLRYFPRGSRGPYGTSTSYLPQVDSATPADFGPRVWEPEFSLGNLHGGSHFVQGYFQQMRHFATAVRSGVAPAKSGLDAALRVMTYMDALVGPFDTWRAVDGAPDVSYRHEVDVPERFDCPRTGQPMVLKDGWNYVCRECGKTRSAKLGRGFSCGLAR